MGSGLGLGSRLGSGPQLGPEPRLGPRPGPHLRPGPAIDRLPPRAAVGRRKVDEERDAKGERQRRQQRELVEPLRSRHEEVRAKIRAERLGHERGGFGLLHPLPLPEALDVRKQEAAPERVDSEGHWPRQVICRVCVTCLAVSIQIEQETVKFLF